MKSASFNKNVSQIKNDNTCKLIATKKLHRHHNIKKIDNDVVDVLTSFVDTFC